MIGLETNVPVTDLHVPVSRNDINLPPLERRRRSLVDDDDLERAAASEYRPELTRPLRVEMLRDHDWRGEVLVEGAYKRGKGANSAGGGTDHDEIFTIVCRFLGCHLLESGGSHLSGLIGKTWFGTLVAFGAREITFEQHLPDQRAVLFCLLRASLKGLCRPRVIGTALLSFGRLQQ